MSDLENLTIMFTDIVGFSSMVSSLSRTESEQILQLHDKLVQKVIKRFGGTIIKSVGDSFLVIFRSPTDAVLCSMAIQDTLWEANLSPDSNFDIVIRIALNTGEVRLANGDIFGEAVNIAARLESTTPAGTIYLTEAVYLSMNKNEAVLEKVGEEFFKGIPQPISIYQAKHHGNNLPDEFQDFPYGGSHQLLQPASRSLFTFGRMFVGLSTAIITAFFSWWLTITYMPSPNSIELDKVKVSYREASPINENDIIAFLPGITAEIKDEAKQLLSKKDYTNLRKFLKKHRAEHPDNAYLMMLEGHDNVFRKNYKASIANYEQALAEDRSLAKDGLLSRNLVRLLNHERLKANRLIAQYLSDPMLTALAKRTGQKGLRARYDAFYLLKDSGNLKKVDSVGLNIWDLRELKECKLKKVAVKELKRLNNPRALPALKEITDNNLWQQFKYFCLRADVKAAIAQLENKESDSKGNDGKKKTVKTRTLEVKPNEESDVIVERDQ